MFTFSKFKYANGKKCLVCSIKKIEMIVYKVQKGKINK